MPDNYNRHLYALIACEPSGDVLGAGLMQAIMRHDPDAQFIGIGGPKMTALGLASSFRMEDLAVMGLVEVISHLVPILKIRKLVTAAIISARPCVFIGIDAPDFNLAVEKKVRSSGIPTVHYVSPSVWAWREGRMKKIRASCDTVLSLLPFEKKFYDQRKMPCVYVGHTLASRIPLENNIEEARARLGLYMQSIEEITGKVMGIMPGSRRGELMRMVPVFARTARLIRKQLNNVVFISAAPSRDKAVLLKDLWLAHAPDISLTIFTEGAAEVMAVCDAVLVTCGTAAFEALLVKCPMAVAYKANPISAAIVKRLLKIEMFSLPNLIAGREIVKEFIQRKCKEEVLATEMLKLLNSDNLLMKKEFAGIHRKMRLNSDELAARAVLSLVMEKGTGNTEVMERFEALLKAAQKSQSEQPASEGSTDTLEPLSQPQGTSEKKNENDLSLHSSSGNSGDDNNAAKLSLAVNKNRQVRI